MPEVRKFVHRNFYVDDGLVSRATPKEVIKLITDAQATLATANIRLHKVVSDAVEVMEALPADDRAKDVRNLDLRKETLPSQRSLGVQWSIEEDKFSFKVSRQDKPFTRRGVLSIINSICDPMGIAVPVTLKGKLFLQQLVAMGKTRNGDDLGWDDPLPEDLMRQWQRWKEALPNLEEASLSRCLHPGNFGPIARAELHAFSDASEDAIGVAIYLRLTNHEDRVQSASSSASLESRQQSPRASHAWSCAARFSAPKCNKSSETCRVPTSGVSSTPTATPQTLLPAVSMRVS